MTIHLDLKDINGQPLDHGSRVVAYAQEYEEVSRDESDPSCPIVEEDHDKPRPIKDVPLFIGRVMWNPEQMAVQVRIEKMMVKWECEVSSVRMGGGGYAYELLEDQLPSPA